MKLRLNKPSKLGEKLFYKIRHHKGHGIHSPFVFRLINDVIEEKRPFYFFDDIQASLKTNAEFKLRQEKCNKLAFRLCNFMNPKSILILGNDVAFLSLYASAYNSKCICNAVELDCNKIEFTKILHSNFRFNINLIEDFTHVPISEFISHDAYFLNLKDVKYSDLKLIEPYFNELNASTKFIMINGIRENKENFEFWKSLENHPARTAALDLFKCGILFFKPELSRYEYQISF